MIPTAAFGTQSLRSWAFSRVFQLYRRPWIRPAEFPAATRGVHVDCPPIVPTLITSYVHGTSTTSLLHMTVAEALQRSVERWPDREAVGFLEDGVRKTFAQFQHDVDQAAAGLLAIGMKKGDRLGMWGPNTYEWILFQFATAKAGIILMDVKVQKPNAERRCGRPSPTLKKLIKEDVVLKIEDLLSAMLNRDVWKVAVNPAYQLQEVEFALRKVGCKAIVCPTQFKTQKYCDMLRKICPEIETCRPGDLKTASLPELRSVIVLDSRQPGMLHFEDVMQAGSSRHMQQLQDLQKMISFDDPINIQFTSGTTGAPKGATLSHHNIINNSYFIGRRVGFTWRPHTRICVPVPLYHCFGSVGAGVCMAVHGITAIFPSAGYNGKANLAAMESERCTFIYGTPTMFIDMLNQPDLAKYDLSSVEAGIIAGAPCPQELVKKIISQLGVKEITIGYGTTENSPVTFLASPLDNLERKSATVGYIGEHLEAKIVDPTTGMVVPLGTLGEVLIRGYCVMLEYWGDKAKTDECITKDRWYKTGDIGSMDAFGYCKIEGRIKDLIIRGGENVYPAEIEQFLHKHPKIKEAQVVGVKDERMGEELCACIKLVDGVDCTAEEIKAYCKGQISHFKIPRYILFVTSYPLTVTGKIQKNKLREQVEKELCLKDGK